METLNMDYRGLQAIYKLFRCALIALSWPKNTLSKAITRKKRTNVENIWCNNVTRHIIMHYYSHCDWRIAENEKASILKLHTTAAFARRSASYIHSFDLLSHQLHSGGVGKKQVTPLSGHIKRNESNI